MPGPPSAGVIGAVRAVFAALCFVPMIAEEAGKNRRSVAAGPARDESSIDRSADRSTSKPADDATFWRAAGELALWNLVAQGACNVALLFTDATRVSFLTQASIAFTPILVAITGGRVGAATWAGCAVAVAGDDGIVVLLVHVERDEVARWLASRGAVRRVGADAARTLTD